VCHAWNSTLQDPRQQLRISTCMIRPFEIETLDGGGFLKFSLKSIFSESKIPWLLQAFLGNLKWAGPGS
jgi:hypothetical protein